MKENYFGKEKTRQQADDTKQIISLDEEELLNIRTSLSTAEEAGKAAKEELRSVENLLQVAFCGVCRSQVRSYRSSSIDQRSNLFHGVLDMSLARI